MRHILTHNPIHAQVRSICEELDIAFLGLGFDPKWRLEEVPRMPKVRAWEGVCARTH